MDVGKASLAEAKEMGLKVSSTGRPLGDHMALALTLAAGADIFVSFAGGVPIVAHGQGSEE
ncbi:MAG: hypothetical protein ACE5JO_02620 [Candidatus Binatia bacterium]